MYVLLCFLSCGDHLLVGADGRGAGGGSGENSGAA